MRYFFDFFTNPFIISTAIAWFVSQLAKLLIHWAIYKEFDLKRFVGDGGMPSAHSATVSSMATFTGIYYGFGSFQFAICLVLTIIVCRDAVGVRMETGKQAKIINEIREYFEEIGKGTMNDVKLKEFVGHTPLQVIVGFILGMVVATVSSLILL